MAEVEVITTVVPREVGQTVHIGDVSVTVVKIGGGKVSLGIHAPREVPIDRPERSRATGRP